MTDYYEISDTTSTRLRGRAVLADFRGPYLSDRFREVLPIVDPPSLVYEWANDGPLLDWSLGGSPHRLFSSRMAQIIRDGLGPRDRVEWVPVTIRTSDGVEHPYEVPHFLEYPDVLDEEVTDWGPSGLPIRWVLSLEKIKGLQFFSPPFVSRSVIVSESLLRVMKDAGLTGLRIQRARVYDGSGDGCSR